MRRWGVMAVLILAGPVTALGQELRGRIRETWQDQSGEAMESESFLQNYEISFKNNVTKDLYWQARLRALIQSFQTDIGGSGDSDLLEPFFQIVYAGPVWQASGGTRLTRVSAENQVAGIDRERRDYFGRVAWYKERLPQIDWSVSRIDLQEDDVDATLEDRSLLTMNYGGESASTSLGLENRRFEDRRNSFARTSWQASWNGDLRGEAAGADLVYSAQALVVEGSVKDETPQTLRVDVMRPVRAALFAIDMTPLTGALPAAPALADGDLTTPAVDLTGDLRNLGAEFGPGVAVDTVHVYVERRLLPGNGAEYQWDVYTSPDGDFWTLQALALRGRFNDLENRFEIDFVPVMERFLKLVNTQFSRDEPPLAVTEVAWLGEELRTGTHVRDNSRRSVNGTLAWDVNEAFGLSFTTLMSRRTDAAEIVSTEEDFNTAATATVRQDGIVTTVRLQAINRDTTQGRPERDRIASAGVAFTPLPTFDLSATATHRRNDSLGLVLVESNSVNLRAAARFLNTTEAAFDLAYVRQEEGVLQRSTTRRLANLSIYAPLRPTLIFSGNYTGERIEFSGLGLQGGRTDLDLRSRLSYRPTRVFGATVEYLYQEISGLKGGSTLWDVDWLPFPGGALQLQLSVIHDRRSLTGELRDENRAAVRWTLNPRTLLEIAYAGIRSGAADAGRTDLATVFLEFRF